MKILKEFEEKHPSYETSENKNPKVLKEFEEKHSFQEAGANEKPLIYTWAASQPTKRFVYQPRKRFVDKKK